MFGLLRTTKTSSARLRPRSTATFRNDSLDASATSASAKPTRSANLRTRSSGARAPVLRPIELGAQVVVIKDRRRAPSPQAQSGEQQKIRRAARMDHVKPLASRQPADEGPDANERETVFAQIAQPTAGAHKRVEAVDTHVFDDGNFSVSRSRPTGQITETSHPARLSERQIAHTRVSAGTELFSTRTRALRIQ